MAELQTAPRTPTGTEKSPRTTSVKPFSSESTTQLVCSHQTDPETREVVCQVCGEVLGYDASGRDIGFEQKTRKPVPSVVNDVLGTDLVRNAREIYGAKLPFIRKQTQYFRSLIKKKNKEWKCEHCNRLIFISVFNGVQVDPQPTLHQHALFHAYDMAPTDVNPATINRLDRSIRIEENQQPDKTIKKKMNDYTSGFLQKLSSFKNPNNSDRIAELYAKQIHAKTTQQLSWILFAHPREVIEEFQKYGKDCLALRLLTEAHQSVSLAQSKEENGEELDRLKTVQTEPIVSGRASLEVH